MASQQRTAAVGLLAGLDLSVLSQAIRRLHQPDEDHDFGELLARIDAADRDPRRKPEGATNSA